MLAEVTSDRGASVIVRTKEDVVRRSAIFADALGAGFVRLQDRTGFSLAGLPVVISGMATSAHGWRELPYAKLPFPVDGAQAKFEWIKWSFSGASHDLCFLSGIADEEDVMRGEEAEVMGLFFSRAISGLTDCVVILPGTHSKHVWIKAAAITKIMTFMTGELYALFSHESVLARSISTSFPDAATEGWHAFDQGVAESATGLSPNLFKIRARDLLQLADADENALFLSGLLIGAELTALAREVALDIPFILAAGSRLRPLYARAFDKLGLTPRTTVIDGALVDTLSVSGHAAFLHRHSFPDS